MSLFVHQLDLIYLFWHDSFGEIESPSRVRSARRLRAWPRRAADPSPARAHRRRAGRDRGAARTRAHRARARDVCGDVVGALLVQVVEGASCAASRPRRPGCSSGRAKAPASSTSATVSRSRSASRATTIRRRSSRTRARRPASAGSSATSSRWAPARSRSWTRCASARSTTRARYLFEGVVSGISGYGNSVGVPTVGGEVVFDDCYRDNPLVNVLCLGLLPRERLVLARRGRRQPRGAARLVDRA